MEVSEVWHLAYGHIYCRITCLSPLTLNMVLFATTSDTAVQITDNLLFFPSVGDFHSSSCHSSRLLFVSCCSKLCLRWRSSDLWASCFPAGIYGQHCTFGIKVLLQKGIFLIQFWTSNGGELNVNRSTKNITNIYFMQVSSFDFLYCTSLLNL